LAITIQNHIFSLLNKQYLIYVNSQKMPEGFIPNIIGAIAYIPYFVFNVRQIARLFKSKPF